MVLCGSVMIGVQPLTSQHQSLFDGNRDEDPGMKVPESKIEPPQLPTGKVRSYLLCRASLLSSALHCERVCSSQHHHYFMAAGSATACAKEARMVQSLGTYLGHIACCHLPLSLVVILHSKIVKVEHISSQ